MFLKCLSREAKRISASRREKTHYYGDYFNYFVNNKENKSVKTEL